MDKGNFLTDSGSKIPQRTRENISVPPKPNLGTTQVKRTDYAKPGTSAKSSNLVAAKRTVGKSVPNLAASSARLMRSKTIEKPSTGLKRQASGDVPPPSAAKVAKTAAPKSGFPYKAKNWELKLRLQECEEWVTEAREEAEAKTGLYEKLLSESGEFVTTIDRLERDVATKDQTISNLQSTETRLREEAQTSTAEIAKLRQTIDELERKNRMQQTTINDLESSLSQSQSRINELERTVRELRGKTDNLQSELASSQSELAGDRKTVQELTASNDEMRTRLCESEKFRRFLHNQVQDLKGNIRVFCRVRPPLTSEKENSVMCTINYPDEGTIEVSKGDPFDNMANPVASRPKFQKYEFTFDRVFNPSALQETVFCEISQLVQSALDGYNVCIFAYGQTGSGKTYTMEGAKSPDKRGMIPRTVDHIFDSIKDLEKIGWEYTVEVCFIEIYNEVIRDLLRNDSVGNNLKIMQVDSKTNDVVIPGLTVMQVNSCEDLDRLYVLAHRNRAVAATNFNERSSRSHSITKIKVTGNHKLRGETCYGSLNLVDLAGSERLSETASSNEERFREMKNINKSLSELGNVIQGLFQKQEHIPYRNSKLTHLLQPALGGSSKTLMLVNISPVESCMNESLCSLRFAQKVNQVKTGTTKKRILYDGGNAK